MSDSTATFIGPPSGTAAPRARDFAQGATGHAVVSGSSRTPVMFGLTWNFGGSPGIVRSAG